ncbi:MAG: ATP-binding protein, partial [Trebonia sp.]
ALALWRGPALADVADASFALAPARRLEELRTAATLDRIEADLLLGTDVIPELRALTAAEPLTERPRALLMRALAAAGRQASALAEYAEARELLADRLGVNPSPSLEQVYLEILRQDHSAERTVVPASRPRSSPTWLTSFVGRDDDVSGVLKKLADDRLVTLTGSGGVGKTRLAAEVAGRIAMPTFFAELAPVTDPADVPRTVLGALGLGSHAIGFTADTSADPVGRVCGALARRELTLVLDNCEHVISAAARLAERVLAECPRVRIVTTSREPLRISGETLWVLGSLPEPAAAELLRDRAAAVRPGFALNTANADAIARITRALDGMPLAIELAATWLRTLTPAQLAGRLDDRFALLTGGSRTALPRHQTLRAVVDWSWDLLSDTERVLARRLAVFPAGATLAGAEHVCAGSALPRQLVLPALNDLVAKSILTVTDGQDGDPRYRMLETVRAYCLERLAEADEEAAVRDSFARYFLALAETGDPMLRTAEQGRWFREFTVEQDNLHAALRWALTRGDAETAYRFVRALAYYWIQHGRGDVRVLTRDVVTLPVPSAEESPDALRMAEARVICTFLAAAPMFDLEQVRPAMTAAIRDLADVSAGRLDIHPVAAIIEPMLALYDGSPERAIARFRRYTAAENPMLRAMGLFYAARFSSQLGRVAEAEADCRAAVEAVRPLGDRYFIAMVLMFLSEFAELRADHPAALAMLTEGRAVGAELGVHWVDLWYLDGMLARVRARAGDLAGARADMATASVAMSKAGMMDAAEDARAWLRSIEAEVACRAGDRPGTRRCYVDVLASIEGKPTAWYRPQQVTATVGLAMTELALGDAPRCREGLAEALTMAAGWHEHPPLAAVLDALAAYALRADGANAAAAAKLLGASRAIRGAFDESSLDAPAARTTARDLLGDDAFDAAYANGRALSREEAVALARDVLA